MQITYDIDIKEKDDPYVSVAENVLQAVSATMQAGTYLVDSFPICKLGILAFDSHNGAFTVRYIPEWFPGAKFKRDGKFWKGWGDKMLHEPFNVVKERIVRGEEFQCATVSLLEEMDNKAGNSEYMEGIIEAAVGTIYGGAVSYASAGISQCTKEFPI